MLNPQIKIQILAAIVAILLIVPMCYDIVSGFVLGWDTPMIEDGLAYEGLPVLFELAPDSTRLQSVATNCSEWQMMTLQCNNMLFIPAEYTSSAVTIATTVVSFLAILCAIYYVIAVFNMASIVIRHGILSRSTLVQMRKVSYSMLIAYLLFMLSSYLPTWYYSSVVSLQGYSFVFPRMGESFVIAIIFILLSEILHLAIHLKEEQDLTI